MAQSAFVVFVPEAEPYVGALRERLEPSAALGMPAHITLLYPFMPPEELSPQAIERARAVVASVPAFSYRLLGIGRFPTALYVAPDPAEPFVALTRSLVREFPDYPPYSGQYGPSILPHLTVARAGEAEHAIAEAELLLKLPHAGILASCKEAILVGNSSGRWEPMETFPLAFVQ